MMTYRFEDVSNDSLQFLLKTMQRKQTVDGKGQNQVEGIVLLMPSTDDLNDKEQKMTCVSLTRDLTGLTCVGGDYRTGYQIPIPNISQVLNILSMHQKTIAIEFDSHKNLLTIESGRKRTKLEASLDAKAFSHSLDSLKEFEAKSWQLKSRIDLKTNLYKAGDGTVFSPCYSIYGDDANDMYEALRCDTINGQRLNRFHFSCADSNVEVTVGDPAKGMTTTRFGEEYIHDNTKGFNWDFDGGLDELFKGLGGRFAMHFFDFTEQEQGMRVLIKFLDCDVWAFQAGILS